MKITKKLWEDNYEVALLSLNTKFVQGLKNGSLPKNIFQEYLAQDYFFYLFYFNPDNFLGSLNKTFFKPKIYKQTPTKLKIKST